MRITSLVTIIMTSTTVTLVKCCDAEEFACNDGECIPREWLCDELIDCSEDEDEFADNCGGECSESQFKCSNGKCMSKYRLCNGIENCGTGQDVTQLQCPIPECTLYEFRCNSSDKCIPINSVCDDQIDCDGNEDEEDCQDGCHSTMSRCNNGECIRKAWFCDGLSDCEDGEDEIGCSKCPLFTFRCNSSGQCIHLGFACDDRIDCDGGEDEDDCSDGCHSTMFRCNDGACFNTGWVCDGLIDCNGGEDETGCSEDTTTSTTDLAKYQSISTSHISQFPKTSVDAASERTTNQVSRTSGNPEFTAFESKETSNTFEKNRSIFSRPENTTNDLFSKSFPASQDSSSSPMPYWIIMVRIVGGAAMIVSAAVLIKLCRLKYTNHDVSSTNSP